MRQQGSRSPRVFQSERTSGQARRYAGGSKKGSGVIDIPLADKLKFRDELYQNEKYSVHLMVVQCFSAKPDVLAEDIAELEVLLVHHTLGAVDDGQLYRIILTADVAGDELELHPQVIIQLCQNSFTDELWILQNAAASEHLPHSFFK